jgi:hypothetical protein
MPVPDQTMFGPRPDTTGITYGEVRQISDDATKIQYLKLRLDTFLISQIDKISLRQESGHPNIWSPFPLLAITFLAIETVGHVICDVEKIKEDNPNEHSKIIVTPVYYQIDKNLSYSPTKTFKEAFEKLHGKGTKKHLTKYSDVIHRYQRNTFNHGYQARGVFIHHGEPKAWTLNEDQGTIVINPYLFWDEFKKAYDNIFTKILNGQEADWRQNALKYFQRLLD